jgi:hypothetical protein
MTYHNDSAPTPVEKAVFVLLRIRECRPAIAQSRGPRASRAYTPLINIGYSLISSTQFESTYNCSLPVVFKQPWTPPSPYIAVTAFLVHLQGYVIPPQKVSIGAWEDPSVHDHRCV